VGVPQPIFRSGEALYLGLRLSGGVIASGIYARPPRRRLSLPVELFLDSKAKLRARVQLSPPKLEFQKAAFVEMWASAVDAYFDLNVAGASTVDLPLGFFLARVEPDLTPRQRHSLLRSISSCGNYDRALCILEEFILEKTRRSKTMERLSTLQRVPIRYHDLALIGSWKDLETCHYADQVFEMIVPVLDGMLKRKGKIGEKRFRRFLYQRGIRLREPGKRARF